MNKTVSERGAALLLLVIFFMMGSLLIALSLARTGTADIVRARTLLESRQALFAAESGTEEVVYRLRSGDPNFTTTSLITKTLDVHGVPATVEVETVINEKHVTTVAQNNTHYRTSYALLHLGDGVSFSFGLQSGDGGLIMKNSSEVIGDVYANGPVDGDGTNESNGNKIYGHVVSAGPAGLVDGVVATGSIWAHSIDNASSSKYAFYQSITTDNKIGGVQCGAVTTTVCFPQSPDQDSLDMPIKPTQITGWQTDAENGGVISGVTACPSGTLTISASTSTGPKKIDCNVIVEGNTTVWSLTGPIWITGTLEVRTGADIAVDASLAGQSPPLITDGTITLNNSGDFLGASGNSFLLLIGLKGNPTTEVAINAQQGTGGKAVLYAPNGKILMQQSVNVKELTAHTVELQNNTQVRYESGLMTLTTPDPDGGYALDAWREIP